MYGFPAWTAQAGRVVGPPAARRAPDPNAVGVPGVRRPAVGGAYFRV